MIKNFLCLGAGPGIGLATAIRFAREGFKATLVARNRARLEKVAEKFASQTGESAEIVAGDVGDANFVRDLAKNRSNLDVLHFNAAIVRGQTLAEATYEDLNKDITVGLTGALYAVKAFASAMLARKAGTILLTGGALALTPSPQYIALGITKAGIKNLAEALFETFKRQGAHIAYLNVAAAAAPDSEEAKGAAQKFWELHAQAPDAWTVSETYGDGIF